MINTLKRELSKYIGIDALVLYGSFARGTQGANSDIDLAILINKNFVKETFVKILKNLLKNYLLLYILDVELRNKIVVLFRDIPKIEFALLTNIEDIKKNYIGSEILLDRISQTILFDKTCEVEKYLREIIENNPTFNKKEIVKKLINRFIYEFESCSAFHSRSDAYKFYYFYNIAFHVAIQLRYIANGNFRYYFLPKNFAVENIPLGDERNKFYQLSGSTYLRDANIKKLNLMKFFLSVLTDLKLPEKESISESLMEIYERDYFWNFRDIAKFNLNAKSGLIYRTSSLTSFQNNMGKLKKILNNKNIKTIIDLRSENEIQEEPYKAEFINNIYYVKAPYDPWSQPEWFKKSEHYGTNAEIAYRYYVKGCKQSTKIVFDTILKAKNSIAIHCVAGKDRTGFIIMLINMLIETPYEIILKDYMSSELDAEEKKFRIYYDHILEFGGIEKYLQSCGLSNQNLIKLRRKLSR